MPAVQFALKRMTLTGLPAGAIAYEIKTSGISAPRGVANASAIAGTAYTYIAFPFEGGTGVVRAANETLALNRARVWYKGEHTLAALPHGIALTAAASPFVAIATPRTLFSLFAGNEIRYGKSANTIALFSAISAPTAYTPIVLQVEASTDSAAGGQVHLKLNVPASAVGEALSWKKYDK
jgi:hypothetical protein